MGKLKNESFVPKGHGWYGMDLFPGFLCARILPM